MCSWVDNSLQIRRQDISLLKGISLSFTSPIFFLTQGVLKIGQFDPNLRPTPSPNLISSKSKFEIFSSNQYVDDFWVLVVALQWYSKEWLTFSFEMSWSRVNLLHSYIEKTISTDDLMRATLVMVVKIIWIHVLLPNI